MKKVNAILSAIIMVAMIMSLAACGSNDAKTEAPATEAPKTEAPATEAPTTEAPTTEAPADPIVGTYVGLFNGTVVTFAKDNSCTIGSSVGIWSREDTCINASYKTSEGKSAEQKFNILEEGGITYLKNRGSGKLDGEVVSFAVNEYYPEDKIEEIRQKAIKKVGDTVSSDIIELTVHKAELSWYAKSPSFSGSKVTNVDAACAPCGEAGAFFKAKKGRTLLCLDFTIKNTDRGSLNTNDYIISFSVNQNGQSSRVGGYDLNNENGRYGMNLAFSAISKNGGDFLKNSTSNILISAGETARIKTVGIFTFDADLEAPFELVVALNSSNKGQIKYLYVIE